MGDDLNLAYEALQKAHDSGDVEGAKQIAAYIQTLEAPTVEDTEVEQVVEKESPELMGGAGATLGAIGAAGDVIYSKGRPLIRMGEKMLGLQTEAPPKPRTFLDPSSAAQKAIDRRIASDPTTGSAVKNWATTQHTGEFLGGSEYSEADKIKKAALDFEAKNPTQKILPGSLLAVPEEEANRLAKQKAELAAAKDQLNQKEVQNVAQTRANRLSERDVLKQKQGNKNLAGGVGSIATKVAFPIVGGYEAGAQGAQAYNRLTRPELTASDVASGGANIVGSTSGALSMLPTRYKIPAAILSQGAGAIANFLDKRNPRNEEVEQKAAGGAITKKPQESLAYLKKGGEPEFGEARAYEPSYSEKIRDLAAQYMSPQHADRLFGGPRAQTVDKLNPIGMVLQTPGVIADAAAGFMEGAKEGNYPKAMGNYAVGALNTLPLVKPAGQAIKATSKSLGPKAASMMENYLTKIGGIQHAVPPKKAAYEYAQQTPGRMTDWLQHHPGKFVVPTQSDRMAGVGGPSFSANSLALPEYEGIAWGSGNKPVASGITNLAKDERFGGPENQIFVPLLGQENQHKSNQIVFDKLMEAFYKDPKSLNPELLEKLNQFMRSGGGIDKKTGAPKFSPFADFNAADKETVGLLGKSFDNRGLIAQHVFGGKDVGGKSSQIFDYQKMLDDLADPTVKGAPTFAVGPRAFQLSGKVHETPRPDLNAAFPILLEGKDLNVTNTPVPNRVMFQDFQNKWRADRGKSDELLKSGLPPEPGYFENTVGYKVNPKDKERVYPRQLVNEQLLDNMYKAGHKEGGLVATLKKK